MRDYVDYLKKVMGVNQILAEDISEDIHFNQSFDNSIQEVIKTPIVVWVENLKNFNENEKLLLANMLKAMKIPEGSMAVYDLQGKENYTISSDSIQFEMVKKPQTENQTFSPEMLNEKSELKKDAWSFLQKIMRKFSEATK